MCTYITCQSLYIYIHLFEEDPKNPTPSVLHVKHGEGRSFRHCVEPRTGACSVQRGWREEIQVDLWLCRTSHAGTASQFAACAPQSLLQLYVLKCCLGLTGYQQDWLNQLLEKPPGSCQTSFPVLKHELCQCLEPTPGFGGVEFPGHTQSSSDRELRWQRVTVGAPTAGHSWGTSHSWALPQAPVCWRTHGNGTSLCKPPQSNHIIKKHRSSF